MNRPIPRPPKHRDTAPRPTASAVEVLALTNIASSRQEVLDRARHDASNYFGPTAHRMRNATTTWQPNSSTYRMNSWWITDRAGER